MKFLRTLADLFVPAAQAHEKWFVPADSRIYAMPDFYRFWNDITVAAALAAAAALGVGFIADRMFERSALQRKLEVRIRPLRDHASIVLAMTTGVFLIISALKGVMLADNFPIPADTVTGSLLLGVEGVVGSLLFIGLFTPAAAIGLGGLYLSTFLLFPITEPWDYLYFPGIACFLFFFARGRFSLDWFLGKEMLSTAKARKRAYVALRVMTGLALVVLAAGKWLRPDLHLALMDKYAAFNPYVLLQRAGFTFLTREMYVFLLFVNELVIGLFVTFGFLMRPLAPFLILMFAGSLLFLGPFELIGHLPIFGALFVFFVFGDTYQKRVGPAPTPNRSVAVQK